jgi:hypothetical protein
MGKLNSQGLMEIKIQLHCFTGVISIKNFRQISEANDIVKVNGNPLNF